MVMFYSYVSESDGYVIEGIFSFCIFVFGIFEVNFLNKPDELFIIMFQNQILLSESEWSLFIISRGSSLQQVVLSTD